MEYIRLTEIKVIGARCEYTFTYPNTFREYIADPAQKLFFELPEGYDVSQIPESMLAVPFVGSVMCVSMLLGIGIEVPKLDKTYYECIPRIGEAFHSMFPYAEFCFEVKAKELQDCSYKTKETPSVFFTGGLDATSALIEHISEKPTLINIWGADVFLSDIDSHIALENYMKKLTRQVGNRYLFIKSNCRFFFNDHLLSVFLGKILKPEHNHGWWSSIGHIPSMAATIAPLMYLEKVANHYIGSGYSIKSKGISVNNGRMVESIKYGSCHFTIVDEELDRCEKAKKIVSYCENNNLSVELMVCWYRTAAKNCSHCEKCYRTMLDILSCHADPNKYGFSIDENGYKKLKSFMSHNILNEGMWMEIISNFRKDRKYWKTNKNIYWLLDFDLNGPKVRRNIKIEHYKARIKKVIKLFLFRK